MMVVAVFSCFLVAWFAVVRVRLLAHVLQRATVTALTDDGWLLCQPDMDCRDAQVLLLELSLALVYTALQPTIIVV
jgi:hypothetical protein